MGLSARNESASNWSGGRRSMPGPFVPPIDVVLARLLSVSRSLSLELIYISPFEFLCCFFPQLSDEDILLSSARVMAPGSIDRLPILLTSSWSFELLDPFEEGLELACRSAFKFASLVGDLGAVSDENPEGGFAVRITGGLAASSSSEISSCTSSSEGCL